MRPIFNRGCVLALVCLLGMATTTAQVLNKPTPADNPNLPGNSPWTAACASDDFNDYFVNFTWNPPLVGGTNEFILELSDADGDFSSPTELARVDDMNTTFDFDFQFALPNDTQGDGYRFRVVSTDPAMQSPPSDPYSMYYIGYNDPILISRDGSGTIPPGGTIQTCGGGDITLATHNVPDPGNYRYSWYRSGTPLSGNSNQITVSQAGMYYVEIDYGVNCSGSANTLSNTIEITVGSSLGIAINPPARSNLCDGETLDLTANITGMGLNYTWYKDGAIVAGPTVEGSTYTVDAGIAGFEGDYAVEIDGTGVCVERSSAIAIGRAGDFEVTRTNDAAIVILPGDNTTLQVTTTADSPTYQWFRNGVAMGGETSDALVVSDAGTYFSRVTQTGGPCGAFSLDSEQTVVSLPASFELVIDYTSAYTDCVNTEITLTIATINAVASNGATTDVTSQLINDFNYQWTRDGADLSGATAQQLTLSEVADNGQYGVDGQLDAFSASSNPLNVTLRSNESFTIDADGTTLCDGGIVSMTTTRDLSGESFRWVRDGATIGTAETLNANEAGTYELLIETDACPIRSNAIVVTNFDDSVVNVDADANVVIVEGTTRTVTATGADSYQWLDTNNTLLGSGPSFTFDTEGQYLLLATSGNCDISRVLTVSYRDTFEIPNVITANGDGINDLWIIPNSYSGNSDVTVILYNEQGEEVLNVNNYQNNWPESSTPFSKRNQIFYYKIKRTSETLRQGTITVIR